jgi:hypothetical protein
MKSRVCLILLALVLVVSMVAFVACGNHTNNAPNSNGTRT